MRFPYLLLAALLIWFAPMAKAETAPPPDAPVPAATEGQTPAPTSAQNTPAPVARKEDEKAGILATIMAYGTNKTSLANRIAGLEATVADLTKERDAAAAERDQLRAENEKMSADLTALGNWLAEHGSNLEQAKAEPAKAFETAVSATVATVARQIGVPVAKVPSPTAGSTIADQISALRADLQATDDPTEKGKIIARIQALKKQSAN